MNTTEQIVDLCSLLYPYNCCHEVVVDLNITNVCMKTMISKTLGYGIIAGSTLVKLPQVIKMLNAGSAKGISFVSVLLELLALTFSASYSLSKGFPFSSWGESLFLMIVTASIGLLCLLYEKNKSISVAFIISYSVLSYVLMSGLTPLSVLWSLQAVNLPLSIAAKLVQAFTNHKNGHTGQLSAITAWLLFLGAVVRIFTSIQETGDKLVVMTFSCASVANFIIVFQVMYYWNKTNEFLSKEKSKKKA